MFFIVVFKGWHDRACPHHHIRTTWLNQVRSANKVITYWINKINKCRIHTAESRYKISRLHQRQLADSLHFNKSRPKSLFPVHFGHKWSVERTKDGSFIQKTIWYKKRYYVQLCYNCGLNWRLETIKYTSIFRSSGKQLALTSVAFASPAYNK